MSFFQKIYVFVEQRSALFADIGLWAMALTAFLLLVSMGIVYYYVYHLPYDYFTKKVPPLALRSKNKIVGQFFQNILGGFIVFLGMIMLFTPGQGALTILMGIMLMDFKKKRYYLRKALLRFNIHLHINKLRIKAQKKPLEL